MTATRWTLVRHAPVIAPPGVPAGAILGRLDVAADLGDRAALDRLAAALPAGATRLTSPLRRARDTARAVSPPGVDLIEEAGLIEQHFGDWQGRTHGEIAETDPDAAAAFWRAPMRNAPPGGGEAFVDAAARVRATLDRLSAALPDRDVAAFAHDGTIRAALAVALDCPPENVQGFRFDHLSTTRLDRFALPDGGAAWRIGWVNRVS